MSRENGFAAGYDFINLMDEVLGEWLVGILDSGSMGISDMMFIANEFSTLIVPD